ncbi:lantibiotic dehydratase [Nonomuraea basaltis]|uniref:lantibiotic dehydratase n=1 Tax=Nonomuraea basaltis TaxID=2495887 RepID=UPI00110C4A78|nr:lantibiotic dehydratase [Nonomuraea basaltis]TMR90636.1 lantibiotic dehydratase [Nonomuraea basaltis]
MGARFFQSSGLVLARVSTDPGNLELPDHLDDPDAPASADQQWLDCVWARPHVRAAIRVASPALAEQLDVVTSVGATPARLRRLVLAVVSYLLRWQRRPIPFGLFAGVTPALIGHAAKTSFGPGHQVVMRADGEWLSTLVDRLETHPGVLPRLQVTVNNAGFVRGDRFVIPGRPHDTMAQQPGPLTEITIRHTRPVRAALAAAASPIAFAQLAEQLHAAFATAALDTITIMLTDLVKQGILLTSLRPPTTVVDGLPRVIAQLRAAGGGLPDVAALLTDLAEVQHALTCHHAADPLAHAELVSITAADRMIAICDSTGNVLAADTAVDGMICLPHAVVDEAAAAASLLLRLTSRPFGAEVWRDFHVAFRARYGPGALVPVRELIADSGLGFPPGFLGAPRGRAARTMTDRDTALLTLIQQAAVDGRQEITLTEPLIQTLTVGDPAEMVVPHRAELAFELHAASAEAVERGAFTLWVTGVPRPTSSMAGRFAHLLPEQARDLLAASFAVPSDAVAAQLSFPPRRRHNESVVRVPQLLPAVISLSEHPAAGADLISVDDLAVTADATQMHVVQVSTGRRMVPWVLHALEASVHTPPLARFLAGVACARHAVYGPIDFGAARKLPHLPRIRYGRTVLAPARWILNAADLATPREPMEMWEKRLDAWRDRWHVPACIVLCQDEQRLPLDLDARLDRILLRTRLDRAGRVELREAAIAPGQGWIGRACEFLALLTAIPTVGRPVRLPATVQRPTAMLMPGAGDLLHARLYGHPDRYGDILTKHLPRLFDSLPLERWWFRRYRDTLRPDSLQELWLYLHLASPDQYGTAAARLAGFATDLQSQSLANHLVLAPYQPQTGRYGPGATMAAAQDVAAADSAAALAQISMTARAGLPAQAIAAASMADLAAGLAPDPGEGCRWLLGQLQPDSRMLARTLRDRALLLADPADDYQALRLHPGGPEVAAAWETRKAALDAYRARLAGHREPVTVLRSLLHDHHVRALGVDPDTERVTNRLARAAAMRRLCACR